MNILLEVHYGDFEGYSVADYLLVTMDASTVQRLRELVTATQMFGEQCGKQFGVDGLSEEWVTNSVLFSTNDALFGAKLQWVKQDALGEFDAEISNALKDKGWAFVPDDFPVTEQDEDEEDLIVRTELDYLKIWTRGGDIRFLANPDDVDVQMWAGDLNLAQLAAEG